MRTLTLLATLLAVLAGLYNYLNARLEQFYIFEPGQLHDLSQRAIAAHGNDTRAVVNYIVSELDEKVPGSHLNKEEEWVFNNAGGAMGAMYIIHASKRNLSPFSVLRILQNANIQPGITEYLIIFGAALELFPLHMSTLFRPISNGAPIQCPSC